MRLDAVYLQRNFHIAKSQTFEFMWHKLLPLQTGQCSEHVRLVDVPRANLLLNHIEAGKLNIRRKSCRHSAEPQTQYIDCTRDDPNFHENDAPVHGHDQQIVHLQQLSRLEGSA